MLRALAGFMVHPNVGAVLAVDLGVEPITNARLQAFMREHGYPLADVRHAFLSVGSGLAAGLAEGEAIVRGWIGAVAAEAPHRASRSPACASRCNAAARTRSPASPATRSPARSCTS